MNHIVVGIDGTSLTGVYLGLLGVGVIVAVNALANWLAWRRPRIVQHVAKAIITPVMSFLLNRAAPRVLFRREDISPFLWANGNSASRWSNGFAQSNSWRVSKPSARGPEVDGTPLLCDNS
jgi:hypothetical protein